MFGDQHSDYSQRLKAKLLLQQMQPKPAVMSVAYYHE